MRIKKQKTYLRKNKFIAYIFILPALLVYASIVIVPALQTFTFSLFSYKSFVTRHFVGINNYLALFKDKAFLISLWHNIYWSGLTVAVPLTLGLILAVLITRTKVRVLLSIIYFIPVTVPLVVGGVIWKWIYNPVFGLINHVFTAVGLENLTRNWLGDPGIAFYSLFITGTWAYFGFCVLIFMNALQNVDEALYEAAKIDGASEFQLFFHITIPSLTSTITFLIIWSVIGAMRFFDLVYVMTKGGPGRSTEIVGTYIFEQAFRVQRVGYASSSALVLLVIILLLTYGIIKVRDTS